MAVIEKLYRLVKPLTHKGVRYQPGAELPFPDHTAKWLADNGVISTAGSIVVPTKAETERALAAAKRPAGTPKPKHAVRSGGCVGCGWSKK
jgi:hypothetical protein